MHNSSSSLTGNLFKKKLLIVLAVIAIILILDQVIKLYIKSNFELAESKNLIGTWFKLQYIENPGMAFGTTLGSGIWAKLALSIFRILAISGISYYMIKQIRQGARIEFLIAIGLVLAGAAGNLIDSMFYDYIFPLDACSDYNQQPGSGIFGNCKYWGEVEVRRSGFLLGNVVDMFKFEATWPQWVPYLKGKEVFPAIWNLADGSITCGVIMIFLRQRKYFPKKEKEVVTEESAYDHDQVPEKENIDKEVE